MGRVKEERNEESDRGEKERKKITRGKERKEKTER